MSNNAKRKVNHAHAATIRYIYQVQAVEQLEATSPGSRELLRAYQSLGQTEYTLQQDASALIAMGKALALALQLENGAESISSGKIRCAMAKVFMRQQRYSDSEEQIKQSRVIFLRKNNPPTEELTRYALHAVQGLRILYRTTGQTAEMEAAVQEEQQLIRALILLKKK